MVDGPTLANWYDLLSRVVSDLQTERAKRRRARLASLSSLFQLIKTVHADYVGIFVSLKEACIRSRSAEAMAAAKESFFQARSQHAGDRRVLYFDAQALREVHDASESLEMVGRMIDLSLDGGGRRVGAVGLAATIGLSLAVALTACARKEEPPRYSASYPGQPVQTVTGTSYAAYPGLPAPPANAAGVVPAPPPRYMGESNEASSANVDVRRDVRGCLRSGWVLDVGHCE